MGCKLALAVNLGLPSDPFLFICKFSCKEQFRVFLLVSSKQPLRAHKGIRDVIGELIKLINRKARGNCFDTYFVCVIIVPTIQMFL